MLTVIIMLRAEPAWLQRTRAERRALALQHFGSVLARHPAITTRYFDAEAFTTRCSDVLLVESPTLREYGRFVDSLRDTPLIADQCFTMVDIIPMLEDSYDDYEAAHPDTVR